MFMYRQLVLYLVWYSWLLLPVGLAPWRVAAAMERGGWQRCWATWSRRNGGGQQGTHTGPSDAHSCYRQSAIPSLPPPPPHHDAAHTGHALLSTVTRGYNFLHSKVRHKVQRKTIREVQKAAAGGAWEAAAAADSPYLLRRDYTTGTRHSYHIGQYVQRVKIIMSFAYLH